MPCRKKAQHSAAMLSDRPLETVNGGACVKQPCWRWERWQSPFWRCRPSRPSLPWTFPPCCTMCCTRTSSPPMPHPSSLAAPSGWLPGTAYLTPYHILVSIKVWFPVTMPCNDWEYHCCAGVKRLRYLLCLLPLLGCQVSSTAHAGSGEGILFPYIPSSMNCQNPSVLIS